jgi:hypothetical protein
MMKSCPQCNGRLRLDGSCGDAACPRHRPSQRGRWLRARLLNKSPGCGLGKTKTSPGRAKPGVRLRLRLKTRPATAAAEVSAAPAEGGVVNETDLLEALTHVAEASKRSEIFGLISSQRRPAHGSAGGLGRAVAAFYPDCVHLVGEPCALAMFSHISGILQRVPAAAVIEPQQAFVAACIRLGWSWAGSAELRGPDRIITSAPKADVDSCIATLLGWFAGH